MKECTCGGPFLERKDVIGFLPTYGNRKKQTVGTTATMSFNYDVALEPVTF